MMNQKGTQWQIAPLTVVLYKMRRYLSSVSITEQKTCLKTPPAISTQHICCLWTIPANNCQRKWHTQSTTLSVYLCGARTFSSTSLEWSLAVFFPFPSAPLPTLWCTYIHSLNQLGVAWPATLKGLKHKVSVLAIISSSILVPFYAANVPSWPKFLFK